MSIQTVVDELIDDVQRAFEDDGMIVRMPDEVKAKLKDEMLERLCNTYNDMRDDIEMDIRTFAFMSDEEVK